MLIGTVAFMSPEQARGKEVDARTDVWSLGCVLYQMATGHLPFDGETPSDTIALLLQAAPPPLVKFAPGVPDELQRIVDRALEKKREDRYRSVEEMLSDLRELAKDVEAQSRQGRPLVSGSGAGATSGRCRLPSCSI